MRKRWWITIAVAAVGFVLLAVFLAVLAVSANTFRPALESQISQALGRPVTLGDLGFSPFSGSLVASNIAIADDPGFSTTPFLEAKSLRIGVRLRPLIFDRKVIVTSFTAVSPSIHLVQSANGVWNFSSIGRPAGAPVLEQQQEGAFPDLTAGEIKIRGGNATVSSLPQTGKPLVYSNLNLSAQHFSMGRSFPFQLSATLPGGASLSAQGTAGPLNGQHAFETPLNAKIALKHFDPVAAGVVDANRGLAMLADLAAQVTSDGKTLAAEGTVNASRLKLMPNGAPAPNPVEIRFALHDHLATRNGTIDSLDVGTGAVGVSAKGAYAVAPQMTLDLQVSAPKVPIDQIQALLPSVGVRLPSGSSLSGGTLTANLKVSGPANALTINGPVEIENTRLAGFDLGSKIAGLKTTSGLQSTTSIQVIRADVSSLPAGTRIENLYAVVPALGSATGEGTVSPTGALNFHLLAKPNPDSGIAGGALGGLTRENAALGSLAGVIAAKGVPVSITGTTEDPLMQADLSGVLTHDAGGLLKGAQRSSPGDLLNKLLSH